MSNFSVLNESSLHKSLKNYYASQHESKTEVELDGHVYDILTDKNEVIEIQTKNLGKLLPKLMDALSKGHKVKLVHPLVIVNRIEVFDEEGNQLSKRKSPKRGNIYDIFKELTGIYPLLLEKNFSLDIVEISMIECRLRTAEPVQSKNNRRRFRRNWIKTNKKLDEILNIKTFKTREDYLALLPSSLPAEFCAKDLQSALKSQGETARIYNNAHLILWVFSHMNIITFTQKLNRSNYYTSSIN